LLIRKQLSERQNRENFQRIFQNSSVDKAKCAISFDSQSIARRRLIEVKVEVALTSDSLSDSIEIANIRSEKI
jgi:hypothetical protein